MEKDNGVRVGNDDGDETNDDGDNHDDDLNIDENADDHNEDNDDHATATRGRQRSHNWRG